MMFDLSIIGDVLLLDSINMYRNLIYHGKVRSEHEARICNFEKT